MFMDTLGKGSFQSEADTTKCVYDYGLEHITTQNNGYLVFIVFCLLVLSDETNIVPATNRVYNS